MSAWMVVKDGAQLQGQHTDEQVNELIQGNPGSSFMVWRAGMAQWANPTTMPEFQTAAPPAPRQAPPAAPPPAAPMPAAAPAPAPSMDRMKQGGKELLGGAAEQLKKYKESGDSEGYLIHLKLVDKLLGFARGLISEERLDGVDAMAKKIGHLAFPIAALVFVLFGLIAGGRMKSGMLAGMALVIIPAAVIAHYIAFKFLNAGADLIKKSPSKLSSKAFLDCCGLIALIMAVGTFAAAFFALISQFNMQGIIGFVVSLGTTAIFLYGAGAALNSHCLNLEVSDEASAGQEAIGVFSFGMKLLLRLVPFIFGVISTVGALAAIGFLGWLVFAEYPGMVYGQGQTVLMMVFGVTLLPFATYLVFLLYYLSLDVLRAILVIPGKLDRLANQDKE